MKRVSCQMIWLWIIWWCIWVWIWWTCSSVGPWSVVHLDTHERMRFVKEVWHVVLRFVGCSMLDAWCLMLSMLDALDARCSMLDAPSCSSILAAPLHPWFVVRGPWFGIRAICYRAIVHSCYRASCSVLSAQCSVLCAALCSLCSVPGLCSVLARSTLLERRPTCKLAAGFKRSAPQRHRSV